MQSDTLSRRLLGDMRPESELTQTRICQPALFVHGLAVLASLREGGLFGVAGHQDRLLSVSGPRGVKSVDQIIEIACDMHIRTPRVEACGIIDY